MLASFEAWAKDKLRMGWFAIAAIALAVIVVMTMGQQVSVGIWKLALITVGAYGGYWIDRMAFPYARPHALGADDQDGVWTKYDPSGIVYAACMQRRAIIMAATMASVALAL